MVHPNNQREKHNPKGGEGHELVTKQGLSGVAREHLRENAKHRQNHHIDGRVRIEPEQVLRKIAVSTKNIENNSVIFFGENI